MRSIVILLIVLFAGCSAFENEQTVPKELEGEWTWYRTSGGWGQVIVADSVDYTITLKIYSQNKAHWFRNDTLVQEYTIQEVDKDWDKANLVMYKTNNENQSDCGLILQHKPELNELHLPTAHCTDSPTYYFEKAGVYLAPE